MELFSEEHIEKVGMEILKSIQPPSDEIVQKYIEPRGGIYSSDSMEFLHLKTLGPSLMRGYQEIPRVRELPKVSFEVVKSAELNAVAIKTDIENDYLVLLNSGLIREINSFIDLFINSELNQYKEEYQQNKEWLRGLFNQIVIEHELSHIFNGHLGLLSKIWKNQTIEEQRNEAIQKELKFMLQTLEMDADCTGLSRLYGWLHYMSKLKSNPMVSPFALNLTQSFSDIVMAFYAINKFFYDLTSLSKEVGSSTHLTPRERFSGSLGNVLLTIKTYGYDVNPVELMNEIFKKISWVEKIFADEYGIPLNQEFWDNKEYTNHTDVTLKVLHNWVNVQPNLLDFNYIPIVGIERDLKIEDWMKNFATGK